MNRQKDGRTDGHCDSMADPAQRPDSVIILVLKELILCFALEKVNPEPDVQTDGR